MRSLLEYLESCYLTFMATNWFLMGTVEGLLYLVAAPAWVYFLCKSRYWPLVVLYFLWFCYDRRTPFEGGYRLFLYNWHPKFKAIRKYFSSKLVKTADLRSDRNYLLAYYPHAVLSASHHANFLSSYSDAKKMFPGLTFHFATINLFFFIPIYREMALSVGGISVNRESLEYFFGREEKGKAVILFPGGAAETQYSVPGKYDIILEKRKGFVRLALKTGTCLVPTIAFGDNDLFEPRKMSPTMLRIVKWVKSKIGMYFYMPTSVIPRKVPLTTVVGRPIDVPKITHPTTEDIDHYHKLFKEELIRLFNEHKSKYIENADNTELTIAE